MTPPWVGVQGGLGVAGFQWGEAPILLSSCTWDPRNCSLLGPGDRKPSLSLFTGPSSGHETDWREREERSLFFQAFPPLALPRPGRARQRCQLSCRPELREREQDWFLRSWGISGRRAGGEKVGKCFHHAWILSLPPPCSRDGLPGHRASPVCYLSLTLLQESV